MYKIAVYAICKNEIKNVEAGVQSMQEADYICVLDTGSTDGTYEKLLEYQTQNPKRYIIKRQIIKPWRFDVARNESLKIIPSDVAICCSVDLDERLTPTWSDLVRSAGFDGCEMCYYMYAHDHTPDGQPARTIGYGKIHKNSAQWKGKYPLHEVLVHDDFGNQQLPQDKCCILSPQFILLHHYQERREERSNYLPLVKLRGEENKKEEISAVYLAHEFFYQKEFQNCIDFINNTLFPNYALTDQQLYRPSAYLFMGRSYLGLRDLDNARKSFQQGIDCDKTYRDNYLGLAQTCLIEQKGEEVIDVLHACFKDSRHYWSWMEQPHSGGWQAWDMLAIAYFNTQNIDMAQVCSEIALHYNPEEPYLQQNYQFFHGGFMQQQ